jgi:hypothetical protein
MKKFQFLLLCVVSITTAWLFTTCGLKHGSGNKTALLKDDLIAVPLEMSQGYVVLNKFQYEDVSRWRIEVIEHLPSASISDSQKIAHSVILPPKKNYWKIPDDFAKKNRGFSVIAYGLNGNGTIVYKTNPLPISGGTDVQRPDGTWIAWDFGCDFVCIENQCAWRIGSMVHPDGGQYYLSLLELNTNYFYLNSSQMNTFCSGTSSCGWKLTPCPDPYNYYTTSLLQVPSMNTSFCDWNGLPQPGGTWVRGVLKRKPYHWQDPNIMTDILIGQPPCQDGAFGFNAAMATLNLYAKVKPEPPLSCSPSWCSPSVGGIGGTPINPCADIQNLTFGSQDNFFNNIGTILDCYLGKNKKEWKEKGVIITVTDMNDPKNKIDYTIEDVIEKSGDASQRNKNVLKASLYSIGILRSDGQYFRVFKEVMR